MKSFKCNYVALLLISLTTGAGCSSGKASIREVESPSTAVEISSEEEKATDDLVKSDQEVDLGFQDQSTQSIVIEAGEVPPPESATEDTSLFAPPEDKKTDEPGSPDASSGALVVESEEGDPETKKDEKTEKGKKGKKSKKKKSATSR